MTKEAPQEPQGSLLIKDCINAVYQDKYIWGCLWSQPRQGKTTLAGDILHAVYTDILKDEDKAWDATLKAIVFTLEQAIHRLKFGVPCKQYTLNGLHNRVPALNWDDFGAYSNKATTQHSEAWDDFKGGFDVLGTKVAVLISTMVDPTEPTFQLNNKFTMEVQITSLGHYKYDTIEWRQDFKANRIRIRKHCEEVGTFEMWPLWVYQEYDKQRCSLADEIFQRIEDKISSSTLTYVMKVLRPTDIAVLKVLNDIGLGDRKDLAAALPERNEEYDPQAIIRLKARNLIIPTRVCPGHYKYDLTQLARDVLEQLDKEKIKEMATEPPY